MQINLPNDADGIVLKKAEVAGFGKDVTAYVAHLISEDEPSGNFAPLVGDDLVGDDLQASLEMLRRSEEDLAAGKTQDMREALKEIADSHGLKINQ